MFYGHCTELMLASWCSRLLLLLLWVIWQICVYVCWPGRRELFDVNGLVWFIWLESQESSNNRCPRGNPEPAYTLVPIWWTVPGYGSISLSGVSLEGLMKNEICWPVPGSCFMNDIVAGHGENLLACWLNMHKPMQKWGKPQSTHVVHHA